MIEVSVIEVEEQATVGIRRHVPMDQLMPFFDEVFDKVLRALQEAGVQPQGAPFARFHGHVGGTVDVEAGFPVVEPLLAPAGELVTGTLPAARAVEVIHVGPYETLPETYEQIGSWVAERGLQSLDDSWERYDSGPASDPDPATWHTRVVWPVSGPQVASL